MKIIWTFTLLMLPGVVSSISVTGYSGGGVIITCKYKDKHKTNAKYFCKGQTSLTCSDLIRTETKGQWVQSGRFSLFDNTTEAVFTVIIRDLREEDSDTYYCGVDTSGFDPSTEVKLKVKAAGPQIETVRGYSGRSVMINFRYETPHKNKEKYLCKIGEDQCLTLISTNRAEEWKHSGRFSIHDDRSAGLLRLLIKELSVVDSGGYKMTVRVSEDYSFFSEFELLIGDADCCQKSITLSAAAGGSVNISCKYPRSHTTDVKFICRRSGPDLCAEETLSVKESRRWSAEGKIRLYDDREEQLLTGIISPQHSAEYWCGVQSEQGHKTFITRVLLNLTTETTSIPTSTPPTSSSPPKPSSSPTKPSPQSSSSVKSPQSFRTSAFTPASSNTSSGSSLIIPLVLVLLLLIIAGLVLLFLYKKHHPSQDGDSTSQTGPGKTETVYHIGCDYEEIKDTHKQLPTGTSTIYATAQLPTNPSDTSTTLYSTVQKSSGDSEICISSAEDLNYAMVNFHKRNHHDDSKDVAVNHHLNT